MDKSKREKYRIDYMWDMSELNCSLRENIPFMGIHTATIIADSIEDSKVKLLSVHPKILLA